MTFRRDVEQANDIHIVVCDHRDGLHLLLVDEDGDVFAEAVMGDEQARQIIDGLQKALTGAPSRGSNDPPPHVLARVLRARADRREAL